MMHTSRRLIAAIVFITLGPNLSVGCTSMHTVRPVTGASAAPFGPVKAGDKVAVELRDGRTETFVVQEVGQDARWCPPRIMSTHAERSSDSSGGGVIPY